MNAVGKGSADTGSLSPLFIVKRPPFRPSIREFGGNDKPAIHAHDFGAFIISHESRAPAFWALLNL